MLKKKKIENNQNTVVSNLLIWNTKILSKRLHSQSKWPFRECLSLLCILPCYLTYLHLEEWCRVNFGWLSNTALRILFLNQMSWLQQLYSHQAFPSSVQSTVHKSPGSVQTPVHISLHCTWVPTDGADMKNGLFWTITAAKLPAKVENPIFGKNGQPNCSPLKLSETNKTMMLMYSSNCLQGSLDQLPGCEG